MIPASFCSYGGSLPTAAKLVLVLHAADLIFVSLAMVDGRFTAHPRTSASALSQSSRSLAVLSPALHIEFKRKTSDLFFKIWMRVGCNIP